jgi:4-hydroxy-3-methylbut-2-enyl diphosphate reductase
MSIDNYQQLRGILTQRAATEGVAQHTLKCTNSICGQVSGRIPQLKEFCARYDLILFVSYKQSSNGKLLHAQCKAVNEKTYFVTNTTDIQAEWLINEKNIGITGATSTPRWLLEEFAEYIRLLRD